MKVLVVLVFTMSSRLSLATGMNAYAGQFVGMGRHCGEWRICWRFGIHDGCYLLGCTTAQCIVMVF